MRFCQQSGLSVNNGPFFRLYLLSLLHNIHPGKISRMINQSELSGLKKTILTLLSGHFRE